MNIKKFLVENPFGIFIVAILSGLITNLLSSAPPIIYPFLAKPVEIQIWTIIILIFLGFCTALLPFSFILTRTYKAFNKEKEHHQKMLRDYEIAKQEHQNTKEDYEIAKQIVEIDKNLLNSVSELAKGSNPDETFNILAENTLHIVSKIDPLNNCGISIFCPDPKNKNYLITWKGCFTESQEFIRFYIGNSSDEKRGVAGKVYKDNLMRIVHIEIDRNGQIKSDDSLYEIFPGQAIPKYRSFICVPIIDHNGNRLGILSIDSKEKTTFDSNKTQQLITLIANRFAAILTVSLNIPLAQSGC